MSTAFSLLLRLPPALRCHALRNLPTRPPTTQTNHSSVLRRAITQTAPKTPPKSIPPKPRLKPGIKSPPTPQAAPQQLRGQLLSRLAAYLQTHPSILLYRAPSHTSLYFNAYISGTLLFIFAYYQSKLEPLAPDANTKPKWYIRILPYSVASFMALMGMAFMWTPMKLVRTVELIPAVATGVTTASAGHTASAVRQRPRLRFVMKTPLPILGFRDPVIERPLQSVYFNPLVRAEAPGAASPSSIYTSGGTQSPVWKNIPLSAAESFTESNKKPAPKPKTSILNTVRVFNSSLINMFPAMARDLRRMAGRDGMAYISAPGMGRWKLDLQGAELLEDGRALEDVMLFTSGSETGLLGKLGQWLGR